MDIKGEVMSDCFDHELDAFHSMEHDYHSGEGRSRGRSGFSYNRNYHHSKVLSKWRLVKRTEKAKLFEFTTETKDSLKVSQHWIPSKLVKREADGLYIWDGYKFDNPVSVQEYNLDEINDSWVDTNI